MSHQTEILEILLNMDSGAPEWHSTMEICETAKGYWQEQRLTASPLHNYTRHALARLHQMGLVMLKTVNHTSYWKAVA